MKSSFENEIKSIVMKMHEIELDNVPSKEELKEKYALSNNFHEKMKQLVGRVTRRKKASLILRYISTAAAVFVLIWGLTNPSVVLDACDEVIRWFEDHISIQFKSDIGTVEVPEYEIGYVPEGYELEKYECFEYIRKKVYKKDNNFLSIEYGTKNCTINLDNEEREYQIIKTKNGTEIHYFEADVNKKESSMTWLSEDEKVVFILSGVLSKEELLKIQENIYEK